MTFEVGPMPNQMMNSGARAMRGMPLKATTKGSKISAKISRRPRTKPMPMPKIDPMKKPVNVSYIVIAR